jgi:hypothetical protein
MAAGTIGVGTTAAGTTGAAAMHTIAAISKVIVKVSAGAGTTVGAAVSLDIESGRRIIPDLDRFDPGLFLSVRCDPNPKDTECDRKFGASRILRIYVLGQIPYLFSLSVVIDAIAGFERRSGHRIH